MGAARRLVVNADDFGFTEDVNRGIIEAHVNGILTATTLMANGRAFTHAVQLAREIPTLDVGCHLVLVQGESLARKGKALPSTVGGMVKAVLLGQLNPYRELKPQVQRILDMGIRPLHLDTHKHTHLLPPVLDAVARLSEEFSIPWVRRPFDFPLEAGAVPRSKQLLSRSLQVVRSQFHRKLSEHGCKTTDYFAGFQLTGRYGADELVRLFKHLPEGCTEFMTHPGFCTSELMSSTTRLKASREKELRALLDPEVRLALEEGQVELVGYRHL